MSEPQSPLRHTKILERNRSVLVVIDMQERLLSAMHNPEGLTANVLLLVRSAAALKIPVIATTQNAARLGPVSDSIAEHLPPNSPVIDKMAFSCVAAPAFAEALAADGRDQIIVCGVETHICVSQTAMDLIAAGFQVHTAADGSTSRTLERHKLGMERMRDAGIMPAAGEAVVYEWLKAAGTPEFRAILPLVK